MIGGLDDIDLALLSTMRRRPRATTVQLSRVVGIARNTVQARIKRLEDRGVLVGHGPEIDARAAGFSVLAFLSLSITQGAHESAMAGLREIDQVLEIHTVTGQGDVLVKVIAETNDNLHEIVQRITALPEVLRSETQLALHTALQRTTADLLVARTDPV